MDIDPKKITFSDLTEGQNSSSVLIVPDYQRTYVWKVGEQIAEFWQDLSDEFDDAIKVDANKDNSPSLFLGNLILCKNPNVEGEQWIVDGQQRITTIFILIIAFRSWIIKQRKQLVEDDGKLGQRLLHFQGETERILTHKDRYGDSAGMRLKAAPYVNRILTFMADANWEHGYFPDKNKMNEPLPQQTKRIKPIYEFLFKRLEVKLDTDNYQDFFNVIKHLTFIQIKLGKINDAFMFFERTNSRGKDLEVGDLLKAHLFGKHPNTKIIVEIWDDITENSLGNLTRMLKYFYISQVAHITSSRLFSGLKSMIDNKKGDKNENIEIFVTELSHFASFFYSINKNKLVDKSTIKEIFMQLGPHENKVGLDEARLERIYLSIDALNLFNVTQTIPVMWSFVKSFYRLELYDDDRHKETLVKFFETLENYHFINNYVLNRVGNEVEKFYAEYAGKFHKSKNNYDFTDILKSFYNKLTRGASDKENSGIAKRDEFIAVFKDYAYDYKTFNNTHLNYIFDRFNNVNEKGKKRTESLRTKIYYSKAHKDKKDITIEHWFSQKAGNVYKTNGWEHNIGNLIALPKTINNDGRIGSNSPSEKYNMMIKTPELNPNNYLELGYFLNKYGPFEIWDEKQVRERAEDLAERAYDIIWRFSPPSLEAE